MKSQTRMISYVGLLSATILLLVATLTVRAEVSPEIRLSTSSQGQETRLAGLADGVTSRDEFDPLVIKGSRGESTRGSAQQALSGGDPRSGVRTPNVEFWIFDASVELYSDLDRDGYYHGVNLSFDADSIYSEADVYAVLYLSFESGPWNEYASTDDFTLFGASGSDAYVVDTELVSGYVSGEYDLLIELFDAVDGTFLASFGPEDSSQLAFLPIEDAGRDTPFHTTIVVNEGGGGSLGLPGLLALLGVAGLARTRTPSI